MKPSGVPSTSLAGKATPARFRLFWQGITQWELRSSNDLPFSTCQAAVTELLNRQGGKAFLCPSLQKAAGTLIEPGQVNKQLAVEKINEGQDSGIFKVSAEVTILGKTKVIAFCLVVARGPHNNQLHYDIPRNLSRLRQSYPELVVRPFYIGKARILYQGDPLTLSMYSTEWLGDSLELTSCNCAELNCEIPESLGLRRFFTVNLTLKPWVVRELAPELEKRVAAAMVKAQVLFYDPGTGTHLQDFTINAGDFVYLDNPDGSFTVKLTTCREIGPLVNQQRWPGFFLSHLLFHQEDSAFHQRSVTSPEEAEKYAVFLFTPNDVCQGTKEALLQKYGETQARQLLQQWLRQCLELLKLSQPQDNFTAKKIESRYKESIRTITDFLQDETR